MGEYWDMIEEGLIREDTGEWTDRVYRECGVHQTRKDTECNICGKPISSSNLAHHIMSSHHEIPLPARMVRCEICNAFMKQENLQKHKDKLHRVLV